MSLESLTNLLKKHSSLFEKEELEEIESILEKVKERLTESIKLKEKGNKAYQEKEYLDAIDLYTKALKLDPTNEVFYSNRSAAYAKINCEESGIDDSIKALEYNPNFILSYLRLGDFYKKSDPSKALFYYKVGLIFDPKNEKLISKVEQMSNNNDDFLNSDSAKEVMKSDDFKNMFSKVMEDKELMEKLANLNKK
ncbi:TPR repeat-containing protein [Tubulinosema ratisbonensis]|uniref:TPR repeat-containing protein n=1 Tax=Tubulinosema ratisbonensis TaxID=291195 RepID=A0A437AJW4_9MICR|nr:TPR repeat-containing protein [Tubulinosema ratisbonensis]